MEGISVKGSLVDIENEYFNSQGTPWPIRGGPEVSKRLDATHFNVETKAHIVIDTQVCNGCQSRPCLWACPAELFIAKADGGILFNYENCFECGTCYVVCEGGAINWNYPSGGYGVIFYLG